MKPFFFAITIAVTTLITNPSAQGQTSAKADVEKVIFAYRDALNASDINKVISLYIPDAVFLPANAPTATGTDQIKGTY